VKSLLFVCTGNTCRSPLAAALARLEAGRRGMALEASSAGTSAAAGSPASEYSMRAAERRGADLTSHRARPLERRDVAGADLVLGMTSAHLNALRVEHGRELNVGLVTDYLPVAHPRHGLPVADPYGGSEERYEEVARLLEECVVHVLDHLEAMA